jgi:hypothetical protein
MANRGEWGRWGRGMCEGWSLESNSRQSPSAVAGRKRARTDHAPISAMARRLEGHGVRRCALGVLSGLKRSEAGRLRVRAAADGMLGTVEEDESEEGETPVEGRFRLN